MVDEHLTGFSVGSYDENGDARAIPNIYDGSQSEIFDFKDRIDPELASALVEFQGKVNNVKKKSTSYVGDYASYDDIMDTFREVGPECGITPYVTLYEDTITCQILHKNGSLSPASKVIMPKEHSLGKGNNMQGYGSDITYLKRYIIQAMLNMASGGDTNGFEQPEKNEDNYVPGKKESKQTKKASKIEEKEITELKNNILSKTTVPALKALWQNNADFLKGAEKTFPDLYKDLENTYETQTLKLM